MKVPRFHPIRGCCAGRAQAAKLIRTAQVLQAHRACGSPRRGTPTPRATRAGAAPWAGTHACRSCVATDAPWHEVSWCAQNRLQHSATCSASPVRSAALTMRNVLCPAHGRHSATMIRVRSAGEQYNRPLQSHTLRQKQFLQHGCVHHQGERCPHQLTMWCSPWLSVSWPLLPQRTTLPLGNSCFTSLVLIEKPHCCGADSKCACRSSAEWGVDRCFAISSKAAT